MEILFHISKNLTAKILITAVFLGITFSVSSQIDCATETPNVDFLQAIPPNQKAAAFPSANLQVFIYIIRKTNGTAGVPAADAINAFNVMQAKYAPYNICFALVGLGFLDFNSYYNTVFTTTDLNSLMDNNNFHPNAIDIFIVPSTANLNGYARGIPGRAFAIWNNALGNGSTMAHEMGHCLGLYHTHETFYCTEAINGSNCTSCGDMLCDTPADPNLSGKVDASCNYNGGGGYTPLTNNVMSYAPVSCRTQFTNDQKSRMLSTIANSQMLLDRLVPQNLVVSNITYPFTQFNFPFPPQTVTSKNYAAKNNISTSGNVIIGNGADVRFLAENEISLNPGFQAANGSVFKAKIDISCPPNFNFRTMPHANDSDNNEYNFDSAELLNASIMNNTSSNSKISTFLVIPNPTTGVFKLQIDNSLEYPKQIVVRDVLGRVVSSIENPDSFEYEFSLSAEKNGLYMVIVYYSDNVFSKRIIKN